MLLSNPKFYNFKKHLLCGIPFVNFKLLHPNKICSVDPSFPSASLLDIPKKSLLLFFSKVAFIF
jgi:hypothetical protein